MTDQETTMLKALTLNFKDLIEDVDNKLNSKDSREIKYYTERITMEKEAIEDILKVLGGERL